MSVLFGFVVSTSPTPAPATSVALVDWVPMQGDRFIVDTRDNEGYLVHADGSFSQIKVGSGQRRVVQYIGKTYNATTPEAFWIVKSKNIQSDRITFGKTGRFLRLYKDGETRTSYGIHPTANIDEILASDDRYRSMGCVLVSEEVMDILEKTYTLNGDMLEVVTVNGIAENLMAAESQK